MIIRVCMYCGLVLGGIEDGRPERRASHGFCPKHAASVDAKLTARELGLYAALPPLTVTMKKWRARQT